MRLALFYERGGAADDGETKLYGKMPSTRISG